jgi:processive 1,2-diacylglycerol beta-glucosyltransferase
VHVMGFTDRMPDVLAAADVLIHSTAGLTVMEALVVGCRVISYGWGRGHIRHNNDAFARHGLATAVPERAGLRAAVVDAFAHPGRPDPSFAALPTAAAVIAERYG